MPSAKVLEEKISDPEIIADQETWRELCKENANLTPIVEKYKEYKIVVSLSFVNVFDYASRANITIDDVSTPSSIKDYTYRLEKFSGLIPSGTIN